ncbi:MAG: TIM barrel protein [Ferruginibacter sp.]
MIFFDLKNKWKINKSKLDIPKKKKLQLPTVIFLAMLVISPFFLANSQSTSGKGIIFSRNNLSAWCIVPYDVKKRGPEERARMLARLGITKFAYDWREEHVPGFDQEMDALKKHHIVLQAFWMPYGPDILNNKHYLKILALLKRHNIKTQLWWSYGSTEDGLKNMTQQEKVIAVSNTVKVLAEDAAKIGCTVGLYNHNGWFGEPENQLAIIDYVKMPNVGIVYNFNHAEAQVDRFPVFFPKILPHLIALNIAGLKNGNPGKVVPVAHGDSEEEMIRIVGESGYRGIIGIINEDTDPDAEAGLKLNIEGLKIILKSLGYSAVLQTYY